MLKTADFIEVFITSTLISFLVTPFIRMVAIKTNYVDNPQNNKIHAHSTPLLGGVAIFLAVFIGILSQWDVIVASRMSVQISAIIGGAVILLLLGLVDDRIGMGPHMKLLGQFVAAMVLFKSGLRINVFGNYYANLFITYIWVIGMTNSFNLLDNMNGLSSGVSAIAAFFFGVTALVNGQAIVALIAFCLCGSCLGFLRYNFPQANIFMGDAGSLVIGFILSAIALLVNWKVPHVTAASVIATLLILAYPIFDTTLVTVIRFLEKRSVFQGGRDHSSHRLALLGFKAKGAVLIIYLICILLGISAIVVSRVPLKFGILVTVIDIAVLGLLGIRLSRISTGRFGRRKTS
ncbi:MAG: MraY family glycosyltransferase [Candidatus Omnitrophota bacterium]